MKYAPGGSFNGSREVSVASETKIWSSRRKSTGKPSGLARSQRDMCVSSTRPEALVSISCILRAFHIVLVRFHAFSTYFFTDSSPFYGVFHLCFIIFDYLYSVFKVNLSHLSSSRLPGTPAEPRWPVFGPPAPPAHTAWTAGAGRAPETTLNQHITAKSMAFSEDLSTIEAVFHLF